MEREKRCGRLIVGRNVYSGMSVERAIMIPSFYFMIRQVSLLR